MKTSFCKVAFLGLIMIATGCTGAGGGGVEGSGTGGGGSSSYYVTPQTVQGLDNTQWVSSGGSVFTNNLTVTITGICARGISTISATVNGSAVSETALCDGSGNFSWLKVFTGPTAANGDLKTIVFKGLASDNSILYTATAFPVTVDDQVPSDPTMAPSGSLVGSIYVNSSASATATGTSTEYNITCSSSIGGSAGCGSFSYSSGNMTLADTLTVAIAETYTFKAVDLAGNQSPGVSYQMLYSPAMSATILQEVQDSTSYAHGTATTGVSGTNGSLIGGGTYFGVNSTMTNGSVQFGTGGILSNR